MSRTWRTGGFHPFHHFLFVRSRFCGSVLVLRVLANSGAHIINGIFHISFFLLIVQPRIVQKNHSPGILENVRWIFFSSIGLTLILRSVCLGEICLCPAGFANRHIFAIELREKWSAPRSKPGNKIPDFFRVASKWLFKVGQGWSRLVKVGQGWSRLVRVGQGWSRLVRVGQGCSRLFKVVQGLFKVVQGCSRVVRKDCSGGAPWNLEAEVIPVVGGVNGKAERRAKARFSWVSSWLRQRMRHSRS